MVAHEIADLGLRIEDYGLNHQSILNPQSSIRNGVVQKEQE